MIEGDHSSKLELQVQNLSKYLPQGKIFVSLTRILEHETNVEESKIANDGTLNNGKVCREHVKMSTIAESTKLSSSSAILC